MNVNVSPIVALMCILLSLFSLPMVEMTEREMLCADSCCSQSKKQRRRNADKVCFIKYNLNNLEGTNCSDTIKIILPIRP